jgi:hypothetical protein
MREGGKHQRPNGGRPSPPPPPPGHKMVSHEARRLANAQYSEAPRTLGGGQSIDTMTDRAVDEAIARAMGAVEVTDDAKIGEWMLRQSTRVILIKHEGDTGWTPFMPSKGDWRPSFGLDDAHHVIAFMHDRGFWCRIQTAWRPGDESHAGFTPHGSTGWNGRPDHEASAPLGREARAVVCAALKALGGLR